MTDRFAVSAMTSNKQTTCAFLGDLLSRYDWVSTSSHSPEFVTLVSTNVVPTPLQAALLKASIEFLDAPLNDIQSEIDLLRNLAASLETKIIRLKGIRRDYRAALSPIRRLPSEILVEILRWTPTKQTKLTATEPYHVFGFNVFNIAAGPWHLGQVCSSWRDAVQFLCPEMWSILKFTSPRKHSEKEDTLIPAPKKDMMALLNRALERSQNHGLEFFFRCWGFDKKNSIDRVYEPEEMNQCFDLILTHSKRWGSVELALIPSFVSRLCLVRGRVDLVGDVYLTCAPSARPGTMDAFEIAPKLKCLELTNMHAEANTPYPAENLVLFSDARRLPDHDTAPKYLDIIASAPNLLDFLYHHHSIIPKSPGPYFPQVVHQSFRTLSASLGTLLHSLVVPDLTEMTLESGCNNDGDVHLQPIMCPRDARSQLHGLVVRSHCSLTTLNLVNATMDDNLLPLLRLFPELLSLVRGIRCDHPVSFSPHVRDYTCWRCSPPYAASLLKASAVLALRRRI